MEHENLHSYQIPHQHVLRYITGKPLKYLTSKQKNMYLVRTFLMWLIQTYIPSEWHLFYAVEGLAPYNLLFFQK